MSHPLRIALAEDNSSLAALILEKLALFPERLNCLFHAANGALLLERLAEHAAVDVVLMDIEMPVLDGIQTTERLVARHPHIRVLVLTVFDDERRISEAVRAGAAGYLLKDEPPDRLLEAIEAVARGEGALSAAVTGRTLALLRDPTRVPTVQPADTSILSPRELAVLTQLATGLTHREIASNLFIAPATVRKHIENLYRKLEVSGRIPAIDKARKLGLL